MKNNEGIKALGTIVRVLLGPFVFLFGLLVALLEFIGPFLIIAAFGYALIYAFLN